jgi:hypothetical protein
MLSLRGVIGIVIRGYAGKKAAISKLSRPDSCLNEDVRVTAFLRFIAVACKISLENI